MKKSFGSRIDRWTVVVLAISALAVAGLSWSATRPQPEEAPAAEEPGVAEDVDGTDVKKVILTEEAAQRIGLQTEKVTETTAGGKKLKAVPYAALVYEPNGNTWTYVQIEPDVFMRQHLKVDQVNGDKVLVSEGPAVGTEVVTVGAAELQGVEYGVGEE